MRDIGDRDDQAEAVAVGFAPDRVIEILGVLAIDGDQRDGAQVEPLEDVGLLHVQWHRGRLREHLRRKLVRDLVAMDRRFDRQRCGQLVTKYRQHLADRRAMLVLRRVISTTTRCPGLASLRASCGIITLRWMRLSSGTT